MTARRGLRVGQAAEMLQVSVETLRRWETEGRLAVERSPGGQRIVPLGEVTRLLAERRVQADQPVPVATSARNRFTGVVTRIEHDRVAAVVEVIAGPHRIVSLMTAESVVELGFRWATRRRAWSRPRTSSSRSRSARSRGRERGRDRRWGRDRSEGPALAAGPPRLGGPDRRRPRRVRARNRRHPAGRTPSSSPSSGAASLKDVLGEAKAAYEAMNAGTTVTLATDSSAALAAQIREGAPADVFLSADTATPDELARDGLVAGDPVVFADERAHGDRAGRQPRPRRHPGRPRAGGPRRSSPSATRLPITKYATQLVANLAALPGYPADFEAAYAANVVSKEDSVKAVVAKIELGEGDAGIVYVTDAAAASGSGPSPCPTRRTCPRRMPASSWPPASTGPRRAPSSTGSPGPTGRRSSGATASCPRPDERGDRRDAVRPPAVRHRASGSWGDRSLVALATLFALFLGLPVVALVARTVVDGSLAEAAASPVVLTALWLSLATTAASLVLTVALGGPLAFVLARRRFTGKWLVEAIVDLPIVLPPSVAGLALLIAFGRRGVLGESLEVVGLAIPFTTLAVVLAQTFVSAPFFVRSARAGLAGVDRDLEDAARVDGASERQVARRITVPLAGSALAAGLVMSWARALGEFGATIMFAGNVAGRTQTLPLVVYGEFQGGDLDASLAAAAILVIAAVGVLVAVRVLHWGRALDIRASG